MNITRRLLLAAGISTVALFPMLAHAADTLRLAVTDVDGLESLQREFGPFKESFEKLSGLKMEFFPVSGRTAAVEAMAAGQVDFVLTGPAEYVVFRARTKAEPVVTWQRPNYFSYIIAMENGPVKSLADLKGKKVSFHEIGSTSRHLAAGQLLADAGLTYGKDYEPVFVKVNVGFEAMQRGDLAAIGVNFTDVKKLRDKNPDVKFVELAKSGQLPDDVLIAAPTVPAKTVAKVRALFTEKGEELLKSITSTDGNKKYVGGTFLPTVKDSDYDVIRNMYRAVGITAFDNFAG